MCRSLFRDGIFYCTYHSPLPVSILCIRTPESADEKIVFPKREIEWSGRAGVLRVYLASLIKCYRTFGSDKCPTNKKYYKIVSAERDYAHAHSIRRPLFGIRLTSLGLCRTPRAAPPARATQSSAPPTKDELSGDFSLLVRPPAEIRSDEIRNRILPNISHLGSPNPTAFRCSIILPFDRIPYLNRTNAHRVRLIDLHGAPLFRLSSE